MFQLVRGEFQNALARNDVGRVLLLSRRQILEEADRVAKLGEWPPSIDSMRTLVSRVPTIEGAAAGFDAGIACALGLIPIDRQGLAAKFHANVSTASVAQARNEALRLPQDCDTETAWWLAACSLCHEEGVTASAFVQQLRDFIVLIKNPDLRGRVAKREYEEMLTGFDVGRGYPYGEADGCILGAYLAGYRYGTRFDSSSNVFYIGTTQNSLGLEDFVWSPKRGNSCSSGPVHGSRQYVLCSNVGEFERALKIVQTHLR